MVAGSLIRVDVLPLTLTPRPKKRLIWVGRPHWPLADSPFRFLTNPSLGLYLNSLFIQPCLSSYVYPLVSPFNAKEATAMHPPDGPLAPPPGAETPFRVLPPKSIP